MVPPRGGRSNSAPVAGLTPSRTERYGRGEIVKRQPGGKQWKRIKFRGKWAWRKLVVQLADPHDRPALLRRQGATIGEGCYIITKYLGTEPQLVTIGDRCLIAGGVLFFTHDAATWSCGIPTVFGDIVIGSDVFIGANVVLLPRTRIGDNAIVGAGAVVSGEVPAGTVYAGNPARQICTVEEYRDKQMRRRQAQGHGGP